jgi:hypothetical protein
MFKFKHVPVLRAMIILIIMQSQVKHKECSLSMTVLRVHKASLMVLSMN